MAAKGYYMFDQLEGQLQVWNRCAEFFNLYRDLGVEHARDYLKFLGDEGRCAVAKLLMSMCDKGYEEILKTTLRSLNSK